jgi:hypothetical protein
MLVVCDLVRFEIDEGASGDQKHQLDCQKLILLRASEILANKRGANAPTAAQQCGIHMHKEVPDAAKEDVNVNRDAAMAAKEAEMGNADRQLKRNAKRVASNIKVTKQNAAEPESKKETLTAKADTKIICIMHGGGK